MLRKHSGLRNTRIKAAVARAAKRTKAHIRDNTIPVAFKELIGSLKVSRVSGGTIRGSEVSASVSADAPHAEAVEIGSRPHVPPLAPLIAWVKLRGMQGLKSTKQQRRLRGTTTRVQARTIANAIASYEKHGAVPVDAAEQIARAIQASIAKHGTAPHRFMFKAVPFAQETLLEEVSAAMPDNAVIKR
jgi:hypothetical protein